MYIQNAATSQTYKALLGKWTQIKTVSALKITTQSVFVVLNRSQNSSYRWRYGGKVSLGPLTAAARSLFLWFSVSVPVCERTWMCLLQAFGRCLLARSVSNNAGQTAGRIGLHLSKSGQSVWSCVSTAHTHALISTRTQNQRFRAGIVQIC